MACAMKLPTWTSPFAEIAVSYAISAVVVMVFVLVPRKSTTRVNGGLRPAAEVQGVASGCDFLDAPHVDGAGEDGGGRCAVTVHLVRLLCDVPDKDGVRLVDAGERYTYRALRF